MDKEKIVKLLNDKLEVQEITGTISSTMFSGEIKNILLLIQILEQKNISLKQALNEIREYCNFQIKDNETLIERLEGTNSFRIGKAKSMIIEFKNILKIIDKYMKED